LSELSTVHMAVLEAVLLPLIDIMMFSLSTQAALQRAPMAVARTTGPMRFMMTSV